MNLNEAIDLLKKNKYLVELTALPKIYTNEYGIYAKMTKKVVKNVMLKILIKMTNVTMTTKELCG
jgi:hypothetical protein